MLRFLAIFGLICVTGAGTAYGNDRAALITSSGPQPLLRAAQDGELTAPRPAPSSAAGDVTVVVIAVALQAILVAALLVQRSRRRQAEGTLRVREATLQTSYWRIRQLVGGLIHAEEAARVAMA